MFLVQCCKLCNHKYASNIKGEWSKINCLYLICLLLIQSFHACDCHFHCEEGCYIIMVCHSILYMKLVGFMYHGMSTPLLLSPVQRNSQINTSTPCWLIASYILTQVKLLALIEAHFGGWINSKKNYRTTAQIWVHVQLSTYEKNGQLITVCGNPVPRSAARL